MAEMTVDQAQRCLDAMAKSEANTTAFIDIFGEIAALIDRQQAEIDRLKLLCEKKTIENCKVIKQSFREGVGRPEMIDGKCEGYAISDWDDEPHDSCKECIAGMESEEAWLQEMEGRR